jgi:Protein of unknown function (DUF5818)
MNRRTSMFTGVLLALAPFAFGQEPQTQTGPGFSRDLLASQQLIAWTWMQKPQPAPQPLPPPDKGIPQPDQPATKPANPQAQQQTPSQAQNQTFTGKIVKDGDKYVLRVAGNTSYQLNDQSSVKQYEDKDVKIVGVLDASSNTIRIVKLELLS